MSVGDFAINGGPTKPDIAKDNGFAAWVDANPTPYLDMELGYTRSVHYALNSVSFGVGVNVGYLTRKSRR
jgi:hypothetical protein